MNNKLYNAAHGRIHSLAMEALARLEAKLNSIDPAQLDRDIVDSITEDAQALARLEGALITLKEYFAPTPARREPPATDSKPKSVASPEAKQEPLTVTAEMSPTYKKSVEKEKAKARAAGAAPKKEKKNTAAPPASPQEAFGTQDE